MPLTLDDLSRRPDIEGPDLRAWDAADRLILDESASARADAAPGDVVVIGDTHGALTLGAAADSASAADNPDEGTRDRLRAHQDALVGERALAANAARLGLEGRFAHHGLDADLVRGARLVLLRLPRALDELRDVAGLIAAYAAPDVAVFAGGRVKHMALAMNDVLREHFTSLDISHARQKSRVLIARGPHDGRDPSPRRATLDAPGAPGLVVCAFGGVFAGASLDIGTRLLLEHLPESIPGSADDVAIDLACGSGVVGAALALRHPGLRVHACDQSAAAVASARQTAEANGVADRMSVVRDDGLAALPGASASFIALNPPFHVGAAVHEGVTPRLFEDAARVLRPGGELWTVWNSPLAYRATLGRLVGPTRQIARNAKFTVTASTRR